MIEKIAIYCGSKSGENPEYINKTKELAHHLVEQGIDVVYGGGNIGLMGVLADTMLKKGGKVYGVMPKHLVEMEVAHNGLTELQVVNTMHERKALIEKISDAFIAMPGGMGTLDEIAEIYTWSQLNLHTKPFGFYNIAGYYTHLLRFFKHANTEGFLKIEDLRRVRISENPQDLLEKLKNYKHPHLNKASS